MPESGCDDNSRSTNLVEGLNNNVKLTMRMAANSVGNFGPSRVRQKRTRRVFTGFDTRSAQLIDYARQTAATTYLDSDFSNRTKGKFMSAVLPPAFFFKFAIPVMFQAEMPQKRGGLLKLSDACRLPQVNLLENETPFAELRLAWNEKGLGVSVEVRGKSMPVSSQAGNPTASDGLQIWIDTRNTQSIHRASRFCHRFCFLPVESETKPTPIGRELSINRAREDRELANSEDLGVECKIRKDGYRLEAWLPAKSLVGFDPDANPQLGFYSLIQDAELGRQFLTVNDDFPFAEDPSVWSTLELVSDGM